MKKFVAILLCVITVVSAIALSVSAANTNSLGKSVADLLRPYGITPTFVPDNISTAPVMDGVVNVNEYTSKRVFAAQEEDGEYLPDEINFGGLAAPQHGYSVTEYVAQDEENIYIAFVYTENVLSVELRYNLSQTAIFDGAGVENTGGIKINLPLGTNYARDGYESNANGDVTISGGKGINADADYSFKTMKYGDNPVTENIVEPDEYDAVAVRHPDSYGFEDVTAEFRLSKAAIMKATKENESEIRSIGYYCFAKREAFCDSSAITLQTFIPEEPLNTNGYDGALDFLTRNYGVAAANSYANSWRMLRYICFYEDTYIPGQAASTMPADLFVTETSPTEATSDTSSTTSSTEVSSTTHTSTKTATQTANTSQDAVKPEVIEIKLGCKNSLSLSALAIVPALGLGVALITKKKEDR